MENLSSSPVSHGKSVTDRRELHGKSVTDRLELHGKSVTDRRELHGKSVTDWSHHRLLFAGTMRGLHFDVVSMSSGFWGSFTVHSIAYSFFRLTWAILLVQKRKPSDPCDVLDPPPAKRSRTTPAIQSPAPDEGSCFTSIPTVHGRH